MIEHKCDFCGERITWIEEQIPSVTIFKGDKVELDKELCSSCLKKLKKYLKCLK